MSPAALPNFGPTMRLSVAAAAVLAAPTLVAAQYAIHNAMALTFPACGARRPGRGDLDVMGQRIIVLGGTLLALAVLALPASLVGAIVWLAFYPPGPAGSRSRPPLSTGFSVRDLIAQGGTVCHRSARALIRKARP